jgi:hypothetical protein
MTAIMATIGSAVHTAMKFGGLVGPDGVTTYCSRTIMNTVDEETLEVPVLCRSIRFGWTGHKYQT